MSLKIVCFLFLLLLTSFVNEVTSKNHDGGWDISISATIGVIPDPKDYSCPFKNNSNPNPWHWRGANIGGWYEYIFHILCLSANNTFLCSVLNF